MAYLWVIYGDLSICSISLGDLSVDDLSVGDLSFQSVKVLRRVSVLVFESLVGWVLFFVCRFRFSKSLASCAFKEGGVVLYVARFVSVSSRHPILCTL